METCDPTFQDCLPYSAAQFREALDRLLSSPYLPKIVKSYFPDFTFEQFSSLLQSIENIKEFQEKIIERLIENHLKVNSSGLSLSGLDTHEKNRKYLYLSNHRDIIIDPALLTYSLSVQGYGTPKICLGDNLLSNQLIIDLVKMNKGITVKRNLPPRELLKSSANLSRFIFDQITREIDSVWLAQREGRAKDGNDMTQPGVIKMLTLGSSDSPIETISKLNVVPVAISYEYDPCDFLKARELYRTSITGEYIKAPNEDTQSILTGIQGHKGRIHIAIGSKLALDINQAAPPLSKRDQIHFIATSIDHNIHSLYKNWPSNYIAFDLLRGDPLMTEHYNSNEKSLFIERIETILEKEKLAETEANAIRKLIFSQYAHSVKNILLE